MEWKVGVHRWGWWDNHDNVGGRRCTILISPIHEHSVKIFRVLFRSSISLNSLCYIFVRFFLLAPRPAIRGKHRLMMVGRLRLYPSECDEVIVNQLGEVYVYFFDEI